MNSIRERFSRTLLALAPPPSDPWELAAESIAVKIRWFGLVVGALLTNVAAVPAAREPLNAMLILGLAYTAIDTLAFRRNRVFLKDYPLAIAALEALFIALLCHADGGPTSPFRFYYLLSLVCCALRHSPRTTVASCGLDCASYLALVAVQPQDQHDWSLAFLMLVVFVWVTWAAAALARLLRRGGDELRTLVAERTRALEESQAQVLHQEKMAAFGLLAAGIAHEVGNPLTGISGLVQLLQARPQDDYTRDKLGQVGGQLVRIQGILRELVSFGRPATGERGRVAVRDVVDEALGIAKYYRGGKTRHVSADVPTDLPPLTGVRDQLVQVVFNLVLNAIDATGKGGRIDVVACHADGRLVLSVTDDGCGIPVEVRDRLFRPYFTTKRHGTGLGLFVVRKIVEEHGGRVTANDAPGGGAAFAIDLPTEPGSTDDR